MRLLYRFARLGVAGLLALVAGCYETPKPACQFLCGPSEACPEDYHCSAADGRCHRIEPGGGLAACTDPLPIDAAHLLDSAPAPDADPGVCALALAPADDGTGAARQALVLSELDPGTAIEIYNNTSADLDLGTSDARLVSGTTVVALATAGAGVTVPAHGKAVITWPVTLTDPTAAGGEVVLYLHAPPVATQIADFVCWGATPATSLKVDAEANGKWTASAACPAALAAGAITRLPATDGLDAADYDVTSAPTPETCAP